jgi:hypothetical protein
MCCEIARDNFRAGRKPLNLAGGEITLLLAKWRDGEKSAFDELMPRPMFAASATRILCRQLRWSTSFIFGSCARKKLWGRIADTFSHSQPR